MPIPTFADLYHKLGEDEYPEETGTKEVVIGNKARDLIHKGMRSEEAARAAALLGGAEGREELTPYIGALALVECTFTNELGKSTYPVPEVPQLVYLGILEGMCLKSLEAEKDSGAIRTLTAVRISISRAALFLSLKIQNPRVVLEQIDEEIRLFREMHFGKTTKSFLNTVVGETTIPRTTVGFASANERNSFVIFLQGYDYAQQKIEANLQRDISPVQDTTSNTFDEFSIV